MAKIPFWTPSRLLHHLNRAQETGDLLHPQGQFPGVRDDPSQGGEGYGLGETVAQAMLDFRKKLPRRRYSRVAELLQVPGLGEDKLKDLLFSFGYAADERFVQMMREQVLGSNWTLEADTTEVLDGVRFLDLVDTPSRFEQFVGNRVQQLAYRHLQNETSAKLSAALMRQAYLETFPEGHLGSYALALWFYRFDQDNWFGFEQVRKVIAPYLEGGPSFSKRRELRLFKGFSNSGILVPGICPADLPVVVNYEEQKVTLYLCYLLD
ncbi:MAG: hypothetical protein AAF804_05710 [Bacteroidota bacterium]